MAAPAVYKSRVPQSLLRVSLCTHLHAHPQIRVARAYSAPPPETAPATLPLLKRSYLYGTCTPSLYEMHSTDIDPKICAVCSAGVVGPDAEQVAVDEL